MPDDIAVTVPLNVAPLSKVHALCEDFRRHWTPLSDAELSSYLAKVPEDVCEILFRNLLHIDLKCRRALGESVSQDRYLAQLPQFADVIRNEFQVTTQLDLVAAADTESFSNSIKEAAEPPALYRIGDYVLERELGRGGMGVVYAARHIRLGTCCALKTLPTTNAVGLKHFKQEFRALSGVNHPNLVGLHALQAEAGQWFFTMDLVHGTDFLSYVRPSGQLDFTRLRNAFSQLVRGVRALHGFKIVHRDLKPSNVMVDENGCVLILDFGLVLDVGHQSDTGSLHSAAGTPAYMAPEQFTGDVTPAADWYSVGVMLYEALAGRLPYTGSASDLYRVKQASPPPKLPAEVPPDLVAICDKLLVCRPEDRATADEIDQMLNPQAARSGNLNRPVLDQERLIGRQQETQQLDNLVREFDGQSSAQVIFISGRSGEGKTLLAEHFLNRFKKDPFCTVLAGRCYDRESVPFKAIDSMIDALCNRLASMPDRKVRELIPAELAVLAELFPVLNRIPEVAKLPRIRLENLELQQVKRLASGALRELLLRLSATTKIVCFIDDLQWGDADSAELLLDVLHSPDAPKLLLFGTYRSDEAASSLFLRTWNSRRDSPDTGEAFKEPSHCEVRLEPLSLEDCVRLVIEVIGEDSEPIRKLAAAMAEETRNNPFLLAELAGCYDPRSPSIRASRMEDVLERKLSLLPQEARQLLNVVVVSGHALSIEEATVAAGHASVPLATLTRMRSERLLRMVGEDENMIIDTYHDRIRESVLRDMAQQTRRSLHARLGEVIRCSSWTKTSLQVPLAFTPNDPTTSDSPPAAVQSSHPRIYDLAYHFFEAGEPVAFGYLLAAGEAALNAYAMDNAISFFEKAASVLPAECEYATRYRLWERLGYACGKANRLSDAIVYYQNASEFASGSIEQAAVASGLGDLHNRRGAFDQAIESFDNALRFLGYSRSTNLFWILLETTWLATLCHVIWLIPTHRSAERRKRAELAADVFHNISLVMTTDGDVIRYSHCCIRFAYTAIRSGCDEQIALGACAMSYNYAMSSFGLASKWMLRRAMRFAGRSKDSQSLAVVQTQGHIGLSMFLLGQHQEAERLLLSALVVLDRVGDSFLRMVFHHHLRHVYAVQGNSEKEKAAAEIEYSIAEAVSDFETMCWAQYGLANAKAKMGIHDEAIAHSEQSLKLIDGRGRLVSEAIALNHFGFVLLQASEYSRALEVLEKSRRIIERKFLYLEYMVSTYPRIVESALGPRWKSKPPPRALRLAKRCCWMGWFLGWRFPNVRPMTLRAQGRLYASLGKTEKAKSYFEKSLRFARSSGAEYEEARALCDLAAVSDENRADLCRRATEILQRLKAVTPDAEQWQLTD